MKSRITACTAALIVASALLVISPHSVAAGSGCATHNPQYMYYNDSPTGTWYWEVDLRVTGCWDSSGSWGSSASVTGWKHAINWNFYSNWRGTIVAGPSWYLSGTTTIFYLNWRGASPIDTTTVFKPRLWLGSYSGSVSCRDDAIGPPPTFNRPSPGWYFYCYTN